jgi:hypothetical protein
MQEELSVLFTGELTEFLYFQQKNRNLKKGVHWQRKEVQIHKSHRPDT